MFAFFRTHQKLFLIVITVIIIITFSFFGTQRAMDGSSNNRIKDQVVSSTIDGSKIKKSEIDTLSYFLQREEEIASKVNIQSSVILKDFFETKFVGCLATKFFKNVSSDFQKKLEKAHKFVPYTHPQVDVISAENIWRFLAPSINVNLEALHKKTEFDPETFYLFLNLYLSQRNFSAEKLKKILWDQQTQCNWLKPDRTIMQENMNLFGFNSIVDWFGQDLVDLLSQVILNVADIAEHKGYKVSRNEALADLMKNSKDVLSRVQSGTIANSDSFKELLSAYGMREDTMVDVWRKVLLFRKYMNDIGEKVLLDNLSKSALSCCNKEKASIELYKLPKELELKSFEGLMKLQVYLDATASTASQKDKIAFPSSFLTAAEVEKKHPELVEKRYEVKFKHINLNEIGILIGEKKLWSWQLEDENYALLKNEFTQLKDLSDAKEKRFANLESLDQKIRGQVDGFSRKKILLSDKKIILDQLCNQKEEQRFIGIKTKTIKPVLKGIEDKNLFSALEKEKICAVDENVSEDSSLFCYSDNNEDFYRIALLSKAEAKTVVPFAEAVKEEILDSLLDSRLHSKYSALSDKEIDQMKDKNGSKKPLCEVKNQLGVLVFHDLLDKLDAKCKKSNITRDTLNAYATSYAYFNLKDIKEKMKDTSFDGTILGAWKLEKEELVVTAESKNQWLKDALLSKETPAVWSDVNIAADGNVSFYKFLEKQIDEKATKEEIDQAKKRLSNNAKQAALDDILSRLDDKNLLKFQITQLIE